MKLGGSSKWVGAVGGRDTRKLKESALVGKAEQLNSATFPIVFSCTTTTKMAGLVSYGSSDEEDNMQEDVVQQEVCRKDALKISRFDR